MTDLTTTVDTHLAAYAEPDRDRRRQLLEAVWRPDGELLDPPLEGRGVEAIAGLVDVILQHYPDHRFQRTSEVDTHHDLGRYTWALVAPDGSVPVTGLDVVRVDDTGKLASVAGFFGELEPAA